MKREIQIKAAEGGDDAALLVEIQGRILVQFIERAGGRVSAASRAKG